MSMQHLNARSSLASVVAASIATCALAGPTWDVDYDDDAGQTAPTAQLITINSPIINIFGRLTGYGLTGTDLVDMYAFEVTTPSFYTISTAGGALGGEANFDTQLFLFRKKGGNGSNQRAVALKANDDASDDSFGSRIGEGAANSNVVYLNRGIYFVAITGSGMEAISNLDDSIWEDFGQFGETVSGEERELSEWDGSGAVGDYTIRLQSVQGFVPAPGAVAVLGVALLGSRRRRGSR
ncbi:MAG: hypothetical protein GC172_04940 [Phycisphaera sp.]|nr:hypothetical protein [Phycisphaera sp.]